MLLRLVLLLIVNFVLDASSLYLDDRRTSKLPELSEQIYTNSTPTYLEILEIGLSERIDVKSPRSNKEKKDAYSTRKARNFVSCKITFNGPGGSYQPEYVCTHSENVKMEWREENGRLTGVFSTNLDCPRQQSPNNEKQSHRSKLVRQWRQSTEDGETQDGGAEETDEAETTTLAPAVTTEENVESEDADGDAGETEGGGDNTSEKTGNGNGEESDELETNGEETTATNVENDTTTPNKTDTDDDLDSIFKPPIDDGDLDFDAGIKPIISPGTILEFIQKLANIFDKAGDYILSLLLKHLKKYLEKYHMNEKFNAKVKKLAAIREADLDKVLSALTNAVHQAFGTSYEIELVKYLKTLETNLKL